MKTENNIFLRIALPIPLRQDFDYLPPKQGEWRHLKPGVRIKVPFQKRELIGIFIGYSVETNINLNKLKTVIEIIDNQPIIPEDIYKLCTWAADYYHYSLGEVLSNALPVLLRQGKAFTTNTLSEDNLTKNLAANFPVILNSQQQQSVNAILAKHNTFQVFLLDGVTGSGKTEVYLQVILNILQQEKQVLVLVPEIGLTPQTIQRFRERFAVPVIALHSGLTKKERLNTWTLGSTGNAKIIIGTRSAVFAPLPHLGLIIVDEEHDLSFKQQDSFRYHARDVAIMRARFANIPIVLGSATPAFESLANVQQNKYVHLRLTERAGNAVLPESTVVDLRNKLLQQGFSTILIEEMKATLSRGEQVLLFLNRRGFSPVLLCHQCGWMAQCIRCDKHMTYHQKAKRLHCHHCDSQKKIPNICEACGKSELQAQGCGTERLETVLENIFPNASIARIDRDSTQRKGAMEKLLKGIHAGEHHILIGTQMLAKGHHFNNVTLVSIIDADGGFFSSDFRSLERMGQLILQVAGRAGRMEKPGKVIIQTYHPDHPLLHQLLKENYHQFAKTLLLERKETNLPPYSFFALLRVESHVLDYANHFLKILRARLQLLNTSIQLLGPIPAPMPKRAGRYRLQLLIQADNRGILQQFLKKVLLEIDTIKNKSRVRWSLDVDPIDMF